MQRRRFLQALILAPLAPKLVALSAPCEVLYHDTVQIDQSKQSATFANLTPEQRRAWSADLWNHARASTPLSRFVGNGDNAIILNTSGAKISLL